MTTELLNTTPDLRPSSPALRSFSEGGSPLHLPTIEPWPEPVDTELLLNQLRDLLRRFLVLPQWAPETLALWILHTYVAHLRDVTTYIGIESPVKRCGKTTLLALLAELVHRPVTAANISPSAFFRVIEQLRPTLLIDEADTVLRSNDELRGILNAGYKRDTAYVVRVSYASSSSPSSSSSSSSCSSSSSSSCSSSSSSSLPVLRSSSEGGSDLRPTTSSSSSSLARFSTWCPKAIAAIGHLPETLADRCILIRMHRKSPADQCERLRNLQPGHLRRLCARFALDHAAAIAVAQPLLPPKLNDRAADVWEPLLALADIAAGHWPDTARQAALALAANPNEHSPVGALLLDLYVLFLNRQTDRLFSRDLIDALSARSDRPWASLAPRKSLTERWLADRLRDYDVRPRALRIGDAVAKGYLLSELMDAFRRYISAADLAALQAELPDPSPSPSPAPAPDPDPAPLPSPSPSKSET